MHGLTCGALPLPALRDWGLLAMHAHHRNRVARQQLLIARQLIYCCIECQRSDRPGSAVRVVSTPAWHESATTWLASFAQNCLVPDAFKKAKGGCDSDG